LICHTVVIPDLKVLGLRERGLLAFSTSHPYLTAYFDAFFGEIDVLGKAPFSARGLCSPF
jgi:hypothetical protein